MPKSPHQNFRQILSNPFRHPRLKSSYPLNKEYNDSFDYLSSWKIIILLLFALLSTSCIENESNKYSTIEESANTFNQYINKGKLTPFFDTLPEKEKDAVTILYKAATKSWEDAFYVEFIECLENLATLLENQKSHILRSKLMNNALQGSEIEWCNNNWNAMLAIIHSIIENSDNIQSPSKILQLLLDSIVAHSHRFTGLQNPLWSVPKPMSITSINIMDNTNKNDTLSMISATGFDNNSYSFNLKWTLIDDNWVPVPIRILMDKILPKLMDWSELPKGKQRSKMLEIHYLLESINRALVRLNQAETQTAFDDTLFHRSSVIILRLLQLNAG